jgi:hypothetical protein
MEDLRVPKRRVAAEALLPGGDARHISLFLAETASNHSGPERATDLLNGGHDFVPAFDDDAGAMTFLNRAEVAAVRLAEREVEDDGSNLTLPTEHAVEVVLRGGGTLRGLISYLRAPGRSRLVDFLNEPEPFFPLLEERGFALVNKRHVVRVVLVKT